MDKKQKKIKKVVNMCEYAKVIDTGVKCEQVCKAPENEKSSCPYISAEIVTDLFCGIEYNLCIRGDLK